MTMEFLVASGIGWIVAVGLYLMLRGRSFTVVLGLSLLGYAVNVFIFSMGRLWAGAPPILGTGATAVADPLPQALVLTAIVIGFATTGFVIELALRGRHENGTDQVDAQPSAEERAAHEAAHHPHHGAGNGTGNGTGSGTDSASAPEGGQERRP
jgi:multicomponent K+:H+ antiporter subunit C